jgi:undecaprenyl-diphosphatase
METYLAPLLEWLQLHPHWAGFVVFLTAFLESLLVVGLFLPGSVLMFGFGALVAAGAMELGPTLGWAVLGAIAGDGTSFLIGRCYHQRLRVMWPFYKHPRLMARGVDFFHHHGGKSIILARFVGPVRPILPAVAGMLSMSTGRFFLVNAFSALLWAPAYLLPGLVFGASMGLAAEVAGRLALLLALLITVLWFSLWLVWRLLRLLQPHASYWMTRTLDWSRRHPRLHPLAAGLLDPDHPEARALTLLTVLLLVAIWGFMLTLQQMLSESVLAGLNPLVFNLLQELRTPFADRVLVAITLLGDARVLTLLVVGLSLWLALKGYWKASLHWLAAFAITALLTRILKLSTANPRPLEAYPDLLAMSFPSGHTSLSVAAFGFLALLVARELPGPRRWIPYVAATLVCVPIAFSRLYLGVHWLSDVLGGLTLGLFWVALMGIAYRTHPGPSVPLRPLLGLGCALLVLASGWNLQQQLQPRLEAYQPQRNLQHWTFAAWQAEHWTHLPASRQDLEGHRRHPLNLQWSGELNSIARWLEARGWQEPPRLSLKTLLPEFAQDPELALLPVLPQVHDGRHDVLRRVRYLDDGHLLVLRLWPASAVLEAPAPPLWVGSITLLERRQPLGLVTTLRTAADFRTPFTLLREELAQWPADAPWEWEARTEPRRALLLWPAPAKQKPGSESNFL